MVCRPNDGHNDDDNNDQDRGTDDDAHLREMDERNMIGGRVKEPHLHIFPPNEAKIYAMSVSIPASTMTLTTYSGNEEFSKKINFKRFDLLCVHG